MTSVQILGPNTRHDLIFGCTTDAWAGFDVVRMRGREALSRLYEYDITLMRKSESGPADLDAILNTLATLRVRTESGWRDLHGLVIEAEELDRTRSVLVYRVKLAPPIWTATQRIRCRTFVDNTLEEIVTTVLENRRTHRSNGHAGLVPHAGQVTPAPADADFGIYLVPTGAYRLAIEDMTRLRDVELRRYVVQYNETDFDFLSRLLEEEGLSYYFEHETSRVTMTITDRPGFVSMRAQSSTVRLRGHVKGAGARDGEVVQQLRKVRRIRSQAVTLRDWDEIRPHRVLEASAEEDGADAEMLGRCEFPGRDEGNVDTPDQHPAIIRLQRNTLERELAEGQGSVRTLQPASRFTLHDESGLREDEDLVVTDVETYATQLQPEGVFLEEEAFGFNGPQQIGQYETRFKVLPAGILFRPEMRTPRPRVVGIHSAVVTADECELSDPPEIHCNEDGWVRLRFPWDQRKEAGTASSCWVRASQGWAGAAFGAIFLPRVGQEVLVAYYQGDVERPVIVGRVYNTVQPVPYPLPENKTVSTVKSRSSPNSDGFNELRFEDKTGNEEVFLHAEKNLNEVVKASHSNSVGGDQSYSVGGNQQFSIDGNQVNTVKGTRAVHVTGMQHMTQKGLTSFADQDHAFESINASFSLAEMFEVVAQNARFQLGDSFKILAPKMSCMGTSAHFNESKVFTALGSSAMLTLSKGVAKLHNGAGASIELVGGRVTIRAPGGFEVVNCPYAKVHAGDIALMGDATIDMNAATINGRAGAIKLNG